jgi:excisionase family DNA binding protein
MKKLLDIVELSEILGVTKATIYSWTSQNKIPHIKLTKRLLKFREDEIMEWISQRSVSTETRTNQGTRRCRNKKIATNLHDDGVERILRNAKTEVLI